MRKSQYILEQPAVVFGVNKHGVLGAILNLIQWR